MKNPEINLAKCKIGQRLKTREGKTVVYRGNSRDKNWPHLAGNLSYTDDGFQTHSTDPNKADIIEILPLPKRKVKAPKRLRTALEMRQPIDKQAIRAAIKLLQSLLK